MGLSGAPGVELTLVTAIFWISEELVNTNALRKSLQLSTSCCLDVRVQDPGEVHQRDAGSIHHPSGSLLGQVLQKSQGQGGHHDDRAGQHAEQLPQGRAGQGRAT